MGTIPVAIGPELAGRVRLGLAELGGLTVRERHEGLAAEVEATSAELRTRYAGTASGEVPGTSEARALYKTLGLDPTKTRPSNEALLRRVLKGEALYAVNTLVDALNLASIRYQLPFGLYDRDAIVPPVTLQLGGPGMSYEGIRKGPVNVERRPVLVDARGPFGNPTSDSARTMITTATKNALVVAYAPASFTTARLTAIVEGTAALLARFSGGRVTATALLP